MTHEEKRNYLIKTLLAEQPRYGNIEIPAEEQGQKDLLRSLMNVRIPAPVSDEYKGMKTSCVPAQARYFSLNWASDTTRRSSSNILSGR